tara:strand:- start:2915 stop:3442 length:528 start_codon:yes stop_codon:yes gene_type:complete
MQKLKSHEIKRISVEDFKKSSKNPITIVLDNVRSALNVGSIFRTSDAFLIDKIILCGITATPPNKDIRKSALGANNSIKWEYFEKTEDAIKILKSKKNQIIAIEQTTNSKKLNQLRKIIKPITLIFGNEVDGISDNILKYCDEAIEIPQFGTKHSLNISVAAGIAIWEIWRKIKK